MTTDKCLPGTRVAIWNRRCAKFSYPPDQYVIMGVDTGARRVGVRLVEGGETRWLPCNALQPYARCLDAWKQYQDAQNRLLASGRLQRGVNDLHRETLRRILPFATVDVRGISRIAITILTDPVGLDTITARLLAGSPEIGS